MNKFFYSGVILFTALFSCNKTTEKQHEEDKLSFRQEFISNKNEEEIKNVFNNSSFEIQKKLWIDKLQHLSEQNFDEKIKKNILILKDFVENFGKKEKMEMFGQAITELSNEIPLEDFKLMFTSLEDYDFSGEFIGKVDVPEKFSQYIAKSIKEEINSPFLAAYNKGCNCTWCLFVDKRDLTANCTKTRYGCGFLFLQSCDKAISLFTITKEEWDKKNSLEVEPIDWEDEIIYLDKN